MMLLQFVCVVRKQVVFLVFLLNNTAYLVAFSISFVSASYRVSPFHLQQGRTDPGTKIVTAIGFCTVSHNVWVHSTKLVLCHPCGAWIF